MNDQCRVMYTSIVGSHAWGMEHKDSDYDFTTVYLAPSDEILVGSRYDKGHNHTGAFEDGTPWDQVFVELGHHIRYLAGGNINHFVTMLAPTVHPVHHVMQEPDKRWLYKSHRPSDTQCKLVKIITENPAKNIFHSINGMTTANLRKYFDEGKRFCWDNRDIYQSERGADMSIEEWMRLRGKKLAQIERLVQFGFRVLTTQKYELKGCKLGDGEYADEQRVRQWQKDLVHAYNASDLPEKPDQQPFLDYLFDVRLDNIIDNYDERLSDIYLSPPEY